VRLLLSRTRRFRNAPAVENPLSRLDLSVFLQDVVPLTALRFIGELEVALPSLDENYVQVQELALEDWLQTIELAKQNLNLRRITLNIHISLRDIIRKHRGEDVVPRLTRYVRYLKPLSELKGLNRCFVRGSWSYPCGTYHGSLWLQFPASYRAKGKFSEEIMKRIIMGRDYNGITSGKLEWKLSQWQHSWTSH
jgi:hypothetical protein